MTCSWISASTMGYRIIEPLCCETYSKPPEKIDLGPVISIEDVDAETKRYIDGIDEQGGMIFYIPYTNDRYFATSQKGIAWKIRVSFLDIATVWEFWAMSYGVTILDRNRMMMWEVVPITELKCKTMSEKRRKVKVKSR